jgi:hypothetical protein
MSLKRLDGNESATKVQRRRHTMQPTKCPHDGWDRISTKVHYFTEVFVGGQKCRFEGLSVRGGVIGYKSALHAPPTPSLQHLRVTIIPL